MSVYLYINATLYLIFAVWITVLPSRTAASLGYAALTSGGRSEYLVVYGGLQLGLAAFFALTAMSADTQRTGILFAVCLYAPIVLYRFITVLRFWPIPTTTLAVAVLEISLLLAAVVLWLRASR